MDRYETWNWVLPTGESCNPFTNEGTYMYDECTSLVLRKLNEGRTRPTRVLTTYGTYGLGSYGLGHKFSARHDQTNAFLGDYEIVGIRHPDGSIEGEVPNRKIKHSVCK